MSLEFSHPRGGLLGRCSEGFANSAVLKRLRRVSIGKLPFCVLQSDIRDVVYLNWVVETERVRHLVPESVTLWSRGGQTILTALTYQHGHFGPAFLGPLRRGFPSPLQSNWRLYMDSIHGEAVREPTVLFFRNLISNLVYAVGARIFSDVLPTDLPLTFSYRRDEQQFTIETEPGKSSAPDLRVTTRRATDFAMPADYARFFGDRESAIRWLCLQDAAVARVPDINRLALGRISLPIDCGAVRPLEVVPGSFQSQWLQPIVGGTEPFCFLVERVCFRVIQEQLLATASSLNGTVRSTLRRDPTEIGRR